MDQVNELIYDTNSYQNVSLFYCDILLILLRMSIHGASAIWWSKMLKMEHIDRGNSRWDTLYADMKKIKRIKGSPYGCVRKEVAT